jgi:SNF2 family DNA or RNA helicase
MSSTNNDVDQMRRSDRKRVSTLIKIDGHNVLRQNNYTVTASSYIVGTNVEEIPNGPKYEKKARTGTSQNPVVRKIAPHEAARMAFNDQIRKSIQEKEHLRQNFVLNNFKTLAPFMNDKTLRQWSQVNTAGKSKHHQRDIFVQPERVAGGEMRDYQLVGLNFMLNMHQQNLGMILGDEMGL